MYTIIGYNDMYLPTAVVFGIHIGLCDCRTGMSYSKSLLAVGGVLEFLKNKVEACSEMVDSLLTAVQQSQVRVSFKWTLFAFWGGCVCVCVCEGEGGGDGGGDTSMRRTVVT